jgi:hypothetical protein
MVGVQPRCAEKNSSRGAAVPLTTSFTQARSAKISRLYSGRRRGSMLTFTCSGRAPWLLKDPAARRAASLLGACHSTAMAVRARMRAGAGGVDGGRASGSVGTKRGETEWLRKPRWGVELWRGSLRTKARRSDKFEQGPASEIIKEPPPSRPITRQ